MSSPPTISLALNAALEQHIGPFKATPVQGGSSANNSLAFLITPSASLLHPTNPFRDFVQPGQPHQQYILKIPQNAFSAVAVQRESVNLPKLHAYLSHLQPSPHLLHIPVPVPIAQLPLNALLTHAIPSTSDGSRAWVTSTSVAERLSLCRAFGRAARFVHGFAFSSAWADLPGPLRTILPTPIAEDVHSLSTLEDHAHPQTARDWLRLYLRAESARLAPRFSALVPEPEPPITSGKEELLEGPDLRRKMREQDRAVACISTMERAVADPSLWVGERVKTCFVHGDFTLPNLLVRREVAGYPEAPVPGSGGAGAGEGSVRWTEVGIVDWGDCGVADRRYDLRMGVWSVLYNMALGGEEGEERQEAYVRAFLEAYVGATHHDSGKNVHWVLEDWEKWLALRHAGGQVKEGCWEAWAAAYDVWGLMEEDGEVFGPPGLAVE